MKVIIAGSRSVDNYGLVAEAVSESLFEIREVVCGCARGIDRLGFALARDRGIQVRFFPAWPEQHEWALRFALSSELVEPPAVDRGRSGLEWRLAGFTRNHSMALYADALIAIRAPGKSNGTDDMIERAEKRGLKVYVKRL